MSALLNPRMMQWAVVGLVGTDVVGLGEWLLMTVEWLCVTV